MKTAEETADPNAAHALWAELAQPSQDWNRTSMSVHLLLSLPLSTFLIPFHSLVFNAWSVKQTGLCTWISVQQATMQPGLLSFFFLVPVVSKPKGSTSLLTKYQCMAIIQRQGSSGHPYLDVHWADQCRQLQSVFPLWTCHTWLPWAWWSIFLLSPSPTFSPWALTKQPHCHAAPCPTG